MAIKTTVNVNNDQISFMFEHRYKERLPSDLALGTLGDVSFYLLAYKVTELAKEACEIISKAQNA